MESNSMALKVRELLDLPALTKHVNDTISAIKDAIDKILNDLKVMFTLYSLSKTLGP